jgi:hypothetical protein
LGGDLTDGGGEGAAVLEIVIGLGVVLGLRSERLRGVDPAAVRVPAEPQATSVTDSAAVAVRAANLLTTDIR